MPIAIPIPMPIPAFLFHIWSKNQLDRFYIRDFFAFCKEVLPYEMTEIKRLYVQKPRAEG
jgi:hypothetical protein